MNTVVKKIFISHASIDSQIGEKFLDALIELGIDKSDVFYSSKYHTGVKLGNDFNQTVKAALNNAEIVIFLLTRSFYKSEYCLNEMGATWIKETPFIPILLDGLSYNDMIGFIDSRHIAFKPNEEESYKLLSYLSEYITKPNANVDAESIFLDFVKSANLMATNTAKLLPIETEEISETEKMILLNRFTDGEILLLNYFTAIDTNEIDCSSYYNNETNDYESAREINELENYAVQYNLNYRKAMSLLEKSKLAVYRDNVDNQNYYVYELDIEVFRDLISLSDIAKEYIMRIKAKYGTTGILEEKVQDDITLSHKKCLSPIEEIITNPKFKEIEALLFQYMIDTTSFSLGDRWMADGQKERIKQWELEKELISKLSTNYDSALRAVIFKKLVDVASVTSYGNPREYKMKDEYIEQLLNLCDDAQTVLNTVIANNTCELPF